MDNHLILKDVMVSTWELHTHARGALMRTTLGEGYSCYSCCSCYQVKVKSTPRFGLGWEFDKNTKNTKTIQIWYIFLHKPFLVLTREITGKWRNLHKHGFPLGTAALSLSTFLRIQIFLPAFYVFLLNVFFLLPCYRRYGMIQFVFNKINNFIERHNMTFATPVLWPHVKLGLFESQKNNHRKIRSHVVFFVSWL